MLFQLCSPLLKEISCKVKSESSKLSLLYYLAYLEKFGFIIFVMAPEIIMVCY